MDPGEQPERSGRAGPPELPERLAAHRRRPGHRGQREKVGIVALYVVAVVAVVAVGEVGGRGGQLPLAIKDQ